jgi:hypothetical protein
MTLNSRDETIVRGPDGVLYRISAGQSVPVAEPSVGAAVDHTSSQIRVETGVGAAMDHASSRIRIEPGDDAAMDHASSRIRVEPGLDAAMDHASSRIRIEPGDLTPSRLTVHPGQI